MKKKEIQNVETFEDINYVEGRWGGGDHQNLIETGAMDYGGFNEIEIKLLKAGAVYPDKQDSGMPGAAINPEWHGSRRENYIANYIFATKLAKAGGDTSGLTKVKGQTTNCCRRMKQLISTTGINGISWSEIISKYVGLNYANQTAETQKEWRKLFLYGMAAHTGSDAFAHSSYYKDASSGKMIQFNHSTNNWADNRSKYVTRFWSAEALVFMTVQECKRNWLGDVMDFQVCEVDGYKKFYMGNILKYALNADDYFGEKMVRDEFEKYNYTIE